MIIYQNKAKIIPAQILRSASYLAAKELGFDQLGSVTIGKWASLVLLEKNPLIDIANVQTVNGIFLKGKYLNPKVLLKQAEENASKYV